MRIATSTMYDNQIASIDDLVAEQQQQGNTLSSGKQLDVPSDDPTQIAMDLNVRNTIAQEQQTLSDVTNLNAQLTTVDGALSTLNDVLAKARSIAVQGASSTVSDTQRQSLADQVDDLLQEAISVANTQYSGKYVFGGSSTAGPVVAANGSPVSSVTFNGNLSAPTQNLGGQTAPAGVTLQQAFNYQAADGSADVFQTLIALRNTLSAGGVDDETSNAINASGTTLTGASALNSANFATPLVADSSGNISISIASGQAPNGVVLTFAPGTSITAVVAAINGSGTGVTATLDPKSERLSLASAQPFQIQDTPSPGAANSSNFVEAFGLTTQADVVSTLSRQLGDIDSVTQTSLNARSALGGMMQNVTAIGSAVDSQAVNNTKVQSGIEDADIAKVIAQFSQTQTALQAAYGTTTRLESKTLFDYLQ